MKVSEEKPSYLWVLQGRSVQGWGFSPQHGGTFPTVGIIIFVLCAYKNIYIIIIYRIKYVICKYTL